MSRLQRPCLGTPGRRCPELTTHSTGRCDPCRSKHQAARDAERSGPRERGYGPEHRALRDEWAKRVATGTVQCARPGCGELIHPDEPWDLGHSDDRTYRGPEHRACNRATRGPRRQPDAPPLPRPSVLDTI
jgi:hypothetical protein